ncbi:efflux RND transporter periplasmic adaptor subunit [Lyngbya aestuarii]|uniref:efflux RND transporter periplasmic adaptor subunit n=1 Tax=Lyngbya aestuarii TaxID=118322 RepID=UPI00403E119E
MHQQQAKKLISSAFTVLFLTSVAPTAVLAHAGHGNEFQSGTQAAANPQAIPVDPATAKQMGIKVQPVSSQLWDVGIKTTGQIESQPNQKVEVTAPIAGRVVELLVEPGDKVNKGQPVAVISSPELIQLRVESLDRRTEAEAARQEAEANLKLAKANLERQRQIALAEIAAARTQLEVAQERYDKDAQLVSEGALPRREMLASQTQLAEAKSAREKVNSRREVLEAEAELKRAQASVDAAKSRGQLSDTTYKTRLQQLSTPANDQGLVTVLAPISGTVAQRSVTLGESFEDAGGKLMAIVNNNQVWATANIFEKDLEKVKKGQKVRLKVASLPKQFFTGQITQIDSVVAPETRVVPVRAQLDNSGGQLKPGMFAELEVLTDKTNTAMLAIPSSALVDANGQQLVYVENGQNSYQPVTVIFGESFGDLVEVKSGLFEGDQVVVEGGIMLYAQSLRGGSKADDHGENKAEKPGETVSLSDPIKSISASNLPWWLVLPAGSAIAFAAFWVGRRSSKSGNQQHTVSLAEFSVAEVEQEQESNSPQPTLKRFPR